MSGLLAVFPSPPSNVVSLGPLSLHLYGAMLAMGIVVAAWIAERRWVAKGHPRKDLSDILIWVVIAGVIAARLYHVATDYQLYTHDPLKALEIWNGGLAIWGAVGGGGLAVVVLARQRHLDLGDLADSIAPALLVAQAIGRWGNWFNQELFGGPTNLPWALSIDPAKRPRGYAQYATFHPTFLYESLCCLLVFAVLLVIERRYHPVKGQVFALYAALYTTGRFVWEEMRIDPAHTIGPLRVNAWVSLVVFTSAWALYFWLGHRKTPARSPVALRQQEPSKTGP